MAAFALLNAFVSVNTVDLSDHVKSATLTFNAADLDETAMGDTWINIISGLKSGSVQIEWIQDYASAKVDATLWAALGTVVAVAVRPVNTTIAATNPEYQFNAHINTYSPLQNGVGELAMVSTTWPTSGAVTRDVTP